jgi:transcriptional regulator with XRE-family HTH domain
MVDMSGSKRKVRSLESYAKQKGVKRPHFNKNPAAKSKFKGFRLINKLWGKMVEDGSSPGELADVLGISYGYIMLLSKGKRSCSGMSIDTLRRAADYLNITTSEAALLSEAFEPTDFFLNSTLEDRIELVYEDLKKDPFLSGFAVSDEIWNSQPKAIKLLIAVMFESGGSTKKIPANNLVQIVR